MTSENHAQQTTIHQILVIALVLFSFFMSALVSRSVFERLPHLEDEVAYLYQARIFAGGQVVVDSPTPSRAYWQPFVLDHAGSRFGKYTPGWPLLLAAGVVAGQPWLINALAAALTVALVYRLGRDLFSPDVGLIAAALTAFSPMALLLNGSLMGHSSALFYATLFFFAYFRLGRGPHRLRWGLVAGLMLGMIVITRPLTAVAVALPFVVWSGADLLARLLRREPVWGPLRPLLLLSLVTLLIASAIPLFNDAAVGDPGQNLYTLVWDYDRVGFGECCGRNGHRLEKAFIHARYDLSLTAADLFGWQVGRITPQLEEHLQTQSVYWPLLGLSFFLLIPGLVLGLLGRWRHGVCRPRLAGLMLIIWAGGLVGWLVWGLGRDLETLRDPGFSWLWIAVAALGLLWPLVAAAFMRASIQQRWTWLLAAVTLGIVLVQMTYWIGSQRYSTRYYYEALTAAALLAALGLGWLAGRRHLRWPVYGGLLVALLYSLYAYSTPRINALYRFNYVSQATIDAVQARRQTDQRLLVIVNGAAGDVRWRSMGSLMAVTSPYLDSDIVLAWDYGADGVREQILARFPDREIIEMDASGNEAWFINE